MHLWIVQLNIIFHVIPQILNRTKVWGARWPLNNPQLYSFNNRFCKGRSMPFGIVLLELQLWVLLQDLIHYRDNDSTIRPLIYGLPVLLPVLLPKQALMLAILPTYRPPKHPSNLPLISWCHTIFMLLLFRPASDSKSSMPPRLCPCFITPEDLIPLLICPVDMLLCPL